MPSALASVAPNTVALQAGLRSLGLDLNGLLKSVDVQTVGVVALLVLLGVLIFDLFNFGYSNYAGDTSSYASYGRSLVTGAAKVWDQKDHLGLGTGARGSRNLDTMTQVLDSLAEAVLKYEQLSDNDLLNTQE